MARAAVREGDGVERRKGRSDEKVNLGERGGCQRKTREAIVEEGVTEEKEKKEKEGKSERVKDG